MTEDFKPTLVPMTDGSDYAVPMPLGWMRRLRDRFNQNTETILEWYDLICEVYPFEFNFPFLCTAMGSVQSYLDAGRRKEDWVKDHAEASAQPSKASAGSSQRHTANES